VVRHRGVDLGRVGRFVVEKDQRSHRDCVRAVQHRTGPRTWLLVEPIFHQQRDVPDDVSAGCEWPRTG